MRLRLDVASGGTTLDALDARLPGVLPYVLARRYESGRREAGALGPGWRHGWEVRLLVAEAEVAVDGGPYDGVRFAPVAVGREAREEASGIVLQHHPDAYVLFGSPRRQFVFPKAGASGGALPLAAVQDAAGNALRLEYAGRRLAALTDPEGRRWRFSHDGDRLAAVGLEGAGRTPPLAAFAYSARGELVAVTDAAGHTSRYAYDGGLLVEVVHPTGGRQWAHYTAERRGIALWDDAGRAAHAAHDPLRQLTRTVEPDGAQTLFQHISGRLVVERAAPAGHVQNYYYDEIGRLIGFSTADGRTAELHRHDAPAGTLIVLHREARMASAELGPHNHAVAYEDPAGNRHALDLDASALVSSVTTPAGHAWTLARDRTGRVTEVASPSGRKVRVRWGRGERVVEDTAGPVWRETLDPLGRVTQRTDRLGRACAFRYDAAGKLAGVSLGTYGLDVVHDEAGRLVSTTDTERHRIHLRRDPHGRVEGVDYDGLRLRAQTDAAGRLRSLGDGTRTLEIEYDPLDRVAGVGGGPRGPRTYRYADGETQVEGPDGTRVYSATGDLVRTEDSASGARATFTFGASGELLVAEQEGGEGARTTVITYAPDGLPDRITAGDTEAAFEYDPDGALAALDLDGTRVAIVGGHEALEGPWGRLGLALDAGRRLSGVRGEGGSVTLTYDHLDRPAGVELGGGADPRAGEGRWVHAWTYEGVRIMLTATRRGVVLAVEAGGLAIPVFWQGERRAETLDVARALPLAVIRGPEAVLRPPVRGGEAAVRFWTREHGWGLDHAGVPTAAALGQRWAVLDRYFLRRDYLEAYPERLPGSLPAHGTDYDRSPHEALTGPHLTGPLRPPPSPEPSVGALLGGKDLLPLRGRIGPVAAAAYLAGA